MFLENSFLVERNSRLWQLLALLMPSSWLLPAGLVFFMLWTWGVSIAGPWRWFDDSMLDCCEPLEKIKADGITFGKVACLAHCNGAKVEAFRTSESTIDDFRKYVICCTSSEDCHVITSYHRAVFKQVLWAYLII